MSKSKSFIEVTLNGQKSYYTPKGYAEFRLTLSTGDFHVHTSRKLKRLPKGVWRAEDAEDVNPRLKYPTLESIIEAYNNEGKFADEYQESEDCPLADWVQSFQYGEAQVDDIFRNAELEDDTISALKSFYKIHGKKPLFDLLERHSSLSHESIYLVDGEILSANIGESEHQPDDYLIDAFNTLTPAEKDQVRRSVRECYVSESGWVYVSDNYHRWVLVCNEETLREDYALKPHYAETVEA